MENIEHYFDWAATSPQDKEILRNALELSLKYDGNPSSIHTEGQNAKKLLEQTRKNCAKTLGVPETTIFFTSGGTESDHIPLISLLNKNITNSTSRGRIIVSGIEHPAIAEEVQILKRQGFEVVIVNPNSTGIIEPQDIINQITSDTLFITVMAVNNETGCIQPIYEIADKIIEATQGKRKPHFHVDFVQAAGKIPIELNYKGIDSGAFSAHKICGPRGIGILYLAKEINSFLIGGGQENNIRSGTENIFGAIAFDHCLQKYYLNKTNINNETQNRFEIQKEYMSNFIKELSKIKGCTIVPEIRKNLDAQTQNMFSPWVIQVAFNKIPGNVMVRALDSKGFCISTGSACSAKKQKRPILAAMKASKEIQDTAVRFSFGPLSTEQGIEELLNAINEINSAFNGK